MGRKRIICVDDDSMLLEQYHEILTSLGHEVHLAENGIDCGCLIPSIRPDLIIFDLTMPEMGGIKAIDLLLRGAFRNVYLLVISGNIHDEEKVFLSRKKIPFFHKPVNFSALEEFINTLHQFAPPGIS